MSSEKLDRGLEKTRQSIFSRLGRLFSTKSKIDDNLIGEIEEILISADVGFETTEYLMERIRQRVRRERYESSAELDQLIRAEIKALLDYSHPQDMLPGTKVILVVGVNGTGKTTSIAKLARYYQSLNKKVLLAAADTFRAAAIDQLSIWAERLNCEIIKHQPNADPAAVVFDAMNAALSRKPDVLIIDTAGRLHTKNNLMAELEKIYRVIARIEPTAPHETILVLDAGNGQNALNQAREFLKSVHVDSIFLSKLDGTARGGIVLAVRRVLNIPVCYIGTGEKADDMALFDAADFVEGLFGDR